MIHAVHRVFYAFEDYLTLEADSPIKHEYLSGQIYAMAGGTPEHAALSAAVTAAFSVALAGGRCRVFSSDLRVRVLATGLATYPDVTVVCGPRTHDPSDKNTVVNPIVLVEVTSKSTEDYDRGEKFEDHFALIPSLEEYVLVSHRTREVEVRHRSPSGWTSTIARAGERADLRSIGVDLVVDAIYDAAAEPTA